MPKSPLDKNRGILTSKSVILVEGNDEVGFFEALARNMGLVLKTDVQIWPVNGKNNYRNEFAAFLRVPGFENVRSYGIVCDADDNASSALISIQDMLRDAGQPYPAYSGTFIYDNSQNIKVGIFIMPGFGVAKGMLEDLCLQSIKDHPIRPYVEEYISKVKQKMLSDGPKNESKAKVLAFLAGMKESVSQLGIAAQRGCWSLEHEAFAEIRSFIRELTSLN